jgi:exonuclease I
MPEQKINEIFSQVHNDAAIAVDLAKETEKVAELTLEEKVDYIFSQFLKLEELHNQVTPMLANIEKSPIGKLLGIKK